MTRVQFPGGAEKVFFSPRHCVQIGNMDRLAFYLMVPGALSPERKRMSCEADHSPPSTGDVKDVWSYISTAKYVFILWCLIKHKIRLHGVARR